MAGREKRPLGDVFGLTNFGVNLTRLAPGAVSALRHAHSKQDEFIYIVAGQPVLRTGAGNAVVYPDDDIQALLGAGGNWQFTHKNGAPY